MTWWRTFYGVGGKPWRQVDVEVGPAAAIKSLQYEGEPPKAYVEKQVRAYIGGLPKGDIVKPGDESRGVEVGQVFPLRPADADTDPKDAPGNTPTKPTGP